MDSILKYFPDLNTLQIEQFGLLKNLYEDWNSKINVISRKDMENFYLHHVLHSLGIAKYTKFAPGSRILDVGTGGGFPGVPLAILYPEVDFLLVDSIGKKIKVVNEVCLELGLKNVVANHKRAEEIKSKFDFIVSRAVTTLPEFVGWINGKISKTQKNSIPNGVLYLKGGDISAELKEIHFTSEIFELKTVFKEEFFETKYVVYLMP